MFRVFDSWHAENVEFAAEIQVLKSDDATDATGWREFDLYAYFPRPPADARVSINTIFRKNPEHLMSEIRRVYELNHPADLVQHVRLYVVRWPKSVKGQKLRGLPRRPSENGWLSSGARRQEPAMSSRPYAPNRHAASCASSSAPANSACAKLPQKGRELGRMDRAQGVARHHGQREAAGEWKVMKVPSNQGNSRAQLFRQPGANDPQQAKVAVEADDAAASSS